jgi:hypothetical protein
MIKRWKMSTIEYTEILIHNNSVSPPFPLLGEGEQFGILKIKMKKVKMTTKSLFLLFTIDKTGSMAERASGNTTKMDFVKQTFSSMLTYLSSIDVDIYIQVNTFNTNVDFTITPVMLSKDNLPELISIIQSIHADNSTDLGIALEAAKTSMLDYVVANPDHDVAHIFMTDGQATTGQTSPSVLNEFVCDSYPNIFVGFGFDHNATVLRKFSEKRLAEYQFVDNMENTALVYGETIHRFLYPAVKDVRIDVSHGVIYNWRTNEWTSQITEDVFIGEIEKIYHVKTSNPDNLEAKLFGIEHGDEVRLLDTIFVMPPLIDMETHQISNNDEDLTKYLFRQRVQEMLYSAKNSVINNKTDLRKSFRILRDYMRTNDLLEDAFLKQLCDDIHITYRTFGTRHADMYSSARQASQGLQRSYTASRAPTQQYGTVLPNAYGLRRQNALGVPRSTATDEFDDFNSMPPFPEIDVSVTVETDDEIDNYVSVDTNVSCYTTPSAIQTMRGVSSGATQEM